MWFVDSSRVIFFDAETCAGEIKMVSRPMPAVDQIVVQLLYVLEHYRLWNIVGNETVFFLFMFWNNI